MIVMPIIQTGNLDMTLKLDYTKLSYVRKKDAVIDNVSNQNVLGEMFSDVENKGKFDLNYVNIFQIKNMGWCFYRLPPKNVVPLHIDHFSNYIKHYEIKDKTKIVRVLIMLEDWKPGHYFEADSQSFTQWQAMDYVMWSYDTPHLGGNMGDQVRYSLQLTGTID